MKIDNVIYKGNRYIAFVVIAAYVIMGIFLLPGGFNTEDIINTSTEQNEQGENDLNSDNKKFYINNVPLINQFPELPTGCEVTSAAMLLNFYGVKADKVTLAEQVRKTDLPRFFNGRVVGESPYEYFIGNPRDNKAFGVFNGPIYNLISNYKEAENITGCEFEKVTNKVKEGKPVMVWITRDLAPVQYSSSWYVRDEMFWWPKGEHTVVITGIEENIIIVNDPYGGEEKSFDLEKFKITWENMGRQAISILQ